METSTLASAAAPSTTFGRRNELLTATEPRLPTLVVKQSVCRRVVLVVVSWRLIVAAAATIASLVSSPIVPAIATLVASTVASLATVVAIAIVVVISSAASKALLLVLLINLELLKASDEAARRWRCLLISVLFHVTIHLCHVNLLAIRRVNEPLKLVLGLLREILKVAELLIGLINLFGVLARACNPSNLEGRLIVGRILVHHLVVGALLPCGRSLLKVLRELCLTGSLMILLWSLNTEITLIKAVLLSWRWLICSQLLPSRHLVGLSSRVDVVA